MHVVATLRQFLHKVYDRRFDATQGARLQAPAVENNAIVRKKDTRHLFGLQLRLEVREQWIKPGADSDHQTVASFPIPPSKEIAFDEP